MTSKESMKVAGVIPARYASTRFEGKALADLCGKPIQHVYERSKQASSLDDVIVATDDERIFNTVKDFGGKVAMTAKAHPSGTDRIAEVARSLDIADIGRNAIGMGSHPDKLRKSEFWAVDDVSLIELAA